MTREQLDAIRARVEAATPGPWEAGTAFCCPDCGWVDGPKRTVCPVYEGTKRTHTLDANDAEFIASAREDVPDLLAEVERLTAEVEAKVSQNVALVGMNGRLQQEVERLTKLTEETEAQMHLRIRAGYDATVADAWRAKVAQVEAERDMQAAEAVRQMKYSVKQHEAAQDALRARDAAFALLREARRNLKDVEIRNEDTGKWEWENQDLRNRIDAALAGMS